jgi:tetratricopeptide (TPR) repeat protein
MSNVAKLKKRALEYEQKKQFDKALDTYVLVLAELDEHIDEADVALYNRVGDLLLRKGDVSEAVDHYEKAVDLYIDGGFLNNAIALCNKILRNAPGRNTVYYKLGKISAQKGFINDAKQNFVEYADRMQRAGNMEEAFRSLKELADLCPGLDDIRLMLADQLVKKDRKSEAIEQLQTLYNKFAAEGRTKEARATVDRMKAIDSSLEPMAGTARPTPRANDLIFLDVDYDANAPKKGGRGAKPASADDGPLIEPPADDSSDVLPGLSHGASITPERGDAAADIVSHVDSGLILGFEQTTSDEQAGGTPPSEVLGLERTSERVETVESTTEALAHDELPMLDLPDMEEPPPLKFDPAAAARATSGLKMIMPDDEIPRAAENAKSAKAEKERAEKEKAAKAEAAAKAEKAAKAERERAEKEKAEREKAEAAAKAEKTEKAKADAAPESKPAKGGKRQTPSTIPDLRGLEEEGVSVIDAVFAAGIGNVVDDLREKVLHEPENWALRRELGEALLENGERAAGLKSLEDAMTGLERTSEFAGASSIAEELLRVEPNSVHYHQKRVEYAVRSNDRPRLVDAYLALAECLFRSGQVDKSKAVYGRVLELAPEDARAQSAMREAFGTRELSKAMIQEAAAAAAAEVTSKEPPMPAPAPVNGTAPATEKRRSDPVKEPARPAAEEPAKRPSTPRRESFVNLSDWLRDDETEKSTRIVSSNTETPSEQVGFAEMLTMFKQGVAANVEDTDHESHYDLGVAYKEMGLLDEAISEFQKALRGTEQRVRTYEALGQCFVEKRQYQIALTILGRALNDKNYGDDTLVGVLYLLGYATESLGQMDEALKYYERVFAVDIQFRDIADRLAATEQKSR